MIDFQAADERLSELSTLAHGWDSYDAPPPNDAAMDAARRVLRELQAQELMPECVVAIIDGGVMFGFGRGRIGADIECDNDGDVMVTWYRPQPKCWLVGHGELAYIVRTIKDGER